MGWVEGEMTLEMGMSNYPGGWAKHKMTNCSKR